MSKNNRRAVVFGGSGGIGRAVVDRLMASGFSVVVGYKSNEKQARELVEKWQAAGKNCISYMCDISDYAATEKMSEYILASFGRIDTVVNCSGIARYSQFRDETIDSFSAVMSVNLTGAFNVMKVFSKVMVEDGFGRIVNIASIWGQAGESMEVVYSSSKAGLIGLTTALARELAPSGVTVNAVSPGLIDTSMNSIFSREELADFASGIPMGRAGEPDEVAAAVEFLAGLDASYITGQVIGVNGGLITG